MKLAQDVIIAPVITEETTAIMDAKKYVFKVAKGSTKPEIAHAVETMFKVKVDSVNTVNVKGKPRRRGYAQGFTAAWKKAIVTLTADSKTIEFFDGLH